VKVTTSITLTHNPCGEADWASGLRENLTSRSYGEGLETGRILIQALRQSFTRQSFFKLLKSAGQHVEQWQQETAEAIAKRLLVAAQACVLVWALARATAPAAEPPRALLIRLSGRLMKRHQPYTAPALLAGLWVLLAMVSVLDDYSVADLRRVAAHALPVWQSPTVG